MKNCVNAFEFELLNLLHWLLIIFMLTLYRNKPYFCFLAAKDDISENRISKRYSQDSPPYTAPLSPKLPRTEAHPTEGN